MTEADFIQSIDCCFPYHADEQWRALIRTGASISPNAAFAVLDEICRVPASIHVYLEDLRVMLNVWKQHFDHPLVGHPLPAAEALMHRRVLPVDDCCRMMLEIAKYPGQYAALGIATMACDDITRQADNLYHEIVATWERTTDCSRD